MQSLRGGTTRQSHWGALFCLKASNTEIHRGDTELHGGFLVVTPLLFCQQLWEVFVQK